MNDEIYFQHADKHWRLLPFDLVCVIRHAQNNQNKFAYLWNISGEISPDAGWSWFFPCRITQNFSTHW